MDVKAILIVGGATPDQSGSSPKETVAGVPIAYLDVLGQPVLQRLLQRLRRAGVSGATLISGHSAEVEPFLKRILARSDLRHVEAQAEQLWQAAEDSFYQYAEHGAELVLLVRVGAYTDVDYEELIQHHLDHRCAVTMAVDAEGAPLDLFALNACARKDAATLFRSQLKQLRRECSPFPVASYVNRLRNAADLRCLAVDALLEKNSIRPVGREIKPGIWVGESVNIHPRARLIAPAFIGAHSRIRAAALITRCAVIEQHAEIDCGTVVEDSTVLPFTYVGAGLDVMHSVVGLRRLTHLQRNVEVEICDGKLIGMSALRAVSRIAGSTAAFLTIIPRRVHRRLFAPFHRQSAAGIPEPVGQQEAPPESSVQETRPSGQEVSELPLAVARRYGEQ